MASRAKEELMMRVLVEAGFDTSLPAPNMTMPAAAAPKERCADDQVLLRQLNRFFTDPAVVWCTRPMLDAVEETFRCRDPCVFVQSHLPNLEMVSAQPGKMLIENVVLALKIAGKAFECYKDLVGPKIQDFVHRASTTCESLIACCRRMRQREAANGMASNGVAIVMAYEGLESFVCLMRREAARASQGRCAQSPARRCLFQDYEGAAAQGCSAAGCEAVVKGQQWGQHMNISPRDDVRCVMDLGSTAGSDFFLDEGMASQTSAHHTSDGYDDDFVTEWMSNRFARDARIESLCRQYSRFIHHFYACDEAGGSQGIVADGDAPAEDKSSYFANPACVVRGVDDQRSDNSNSDAGSEESFSTLDSSDSAAGDVGLPCTVRDCRDGGSHGADDSAIKRCRRVHQH